MKKKFRLAFISLTILFLIWTGFRQWPDDYVHLVFCDVGQGDAILIWYKFTQVLVDAGSSSQVLSCLDQKMPFWDRKIELIIATHGDKDHIGGLPDVLSGYNVSQIMIQPSSKNTTDFTQLQEIISRKKLQGLHEVTLRVGTRFSLTQNSGLEILSTRESQIKLRQTDAQTPEILLSDVTSRAVTDEISENDGSIVILVTVGKVKTLLTGDIEEATEQALIQHHLIPDVDILKIAHHGSKNSTSSLFLAVTRPEISVISVGKNNTYRHPVKEVINRLTENGSKIWQTDQMGSIEVICSEVKCGRK